MSPQLCQPARTLAEYAEELRVKVQVAELRANRLRGKNGNYRYGYIGAADNLRYYRERLLLVEREINQRACI